MRIKKLALVDRIENNWHYRRPIFRHAALEKLGITASSALLPRLAWQKIYSPIMSNYLRYGLLAAIIAILFVLPGCMHLDIRTGVDVNNKAYLQYDLEIDLKSVDPNMRTPLIDGVKELEKHYRDNLGFEVTSSKTSDSYSMTAILTVQGSDYEDAFAKLKKMLTDESITPFSGLNMDFATTEMQQLYHLSVTVDLAGMVEGSSISDLPPSMKESIEELFGTSMGTLMIELPGSEIESASGYTASNGHHITLTEILDFSGQTQAELTTRLNKGRTTVFDEPMKDVVSRYQTFAYIGFGVAGLGAVLAVVAIVMMRRKKAQIVAQGSAPITQSSVVQGSAPIAQGSVVQGSPPIAQGSDTLGALGATGAMGATGATGAMGAHGEWPPPPPEPTPLPFQGKGETEGWLSPPTPETAPLPFQGKGDTEGWPSPPPGPAPLSFEHDPEKGTDSPNPHYYGHSSQDGRTRY